MMGIVLNDTFDQPGVAHGPFRVFVATNVVAKVLGTQDEVFDVVYYFGKVSDDENLESRLYEPDTQGNAQISVSRVSLSLEQELRVRVGESFRRWRQGELKPSDYPDIGVAAVYLKRVGNAFWACMVNSLGRSSQMAGKYKFSEQTKDNAVMVTKMYGWRTREDLAEHARLFGLFGMVEHVREIDIVDRPGLLGIRSEANTF